MFNWLYAIGAQQPKWFLGSLANRNRFGAWVAFLARGLADPDFLLKFQTTSDVWERSKLVGMRISTIRKQFAELNDAQKEELKYGPGHFFVNQNSSHFGNVWKGWLGIPGQREELEKRQSRDIQSLKGKAGYLALGRSGSWSWSDHRFGLTASTLVNHGQRLDRVETIIAAINTRNPLGFVCPECLHPLCDLLGSFCGDCGTTID